MTRSIRLSVVGCIVAALFVCAPAAFASTLAKSGPDLTWTAAPGIDNDTDFYDTTADEVRIQTNDDPVVYDSGGGTTSQINADCNDADAGGAGANTDGLANLVICTNTTGGTVTSNSGDGNDNQYGNGLDQGHRFVLDAGPNDDYAHGGTLGDSLTGGSGNDDLYGNDGDDTISGGAGDDELYGGNGNDTVSGGDGNDYADGSDGNDVVDGDAGNDYVTAGNGNDTVRGGDGEDNLYGGDGDDLVEGGAGDDADLYGEAGNDTVNGNDGNDGENGRIYGGPGADVIDGGNGDDRIEERTDWCCWTQDGGADDIRGGAGFDELEYEADSGASSNDQLIATLDDVANDGYQDLSGCCSSDDRNNNFHSDIESLDLYSDNAPTTINGTPSSNQIWICCGGPDNVNPGAGTDILYTYGGPDTVNSDDGYVDFVHCGEGVDTVTADQFDTLVSCENQTVNQRPSALDVPEDAAPSVSWVKPTGGTIPRGGTTFEAAASDDKGIARVVFSVGLREVCRDETAPYTCNYVPRGSDVGKGKVLMATATDTAGQTATSFVQATISRLNPRSVSSRTTPSVDRGSPWKFTTTGRVNRPSTVTAAEGCKGNVSVQIRAGKKTISNRRVGVQSNCTFRSSVSFGIRSRLQPGKLQVLVRFLGNDVIGPRSAKRRTVTAQA